MWPACRAVGARLPARSAASGNPHRGLTAPCAAAGLRWATNWVLGSGEEAGQPGDRASKRSDVRPLRASRRP
eukprot:15849386-Heterocapsa_arctica.AAC.1